jgi:hypothetical protein
MVWVVILDPKFILEIGSWRGHAQKTTRVKEIAGKPFWEEFLKERGQ